jgi:hypothetical protein
MKKLRMTKTGHETSIMNGALYFEDAQQCPVDCEQFAEIIGDGYTKSIRLVSLSAGWYEREWMSEVGFVNYDINVQMTLRREVRSGKGYWYAYRRVLGKLHKRYVGQDEEVTEKLLLKIAQKMPSVN